ncbi:hypothetical protein KCU65_g5150, partial [Aureobasidium melanogenum]
MNTAHKLSEMSVARPLNADDGPITKKLKTGNEDRFPYDTRIAILQSWGISICHVPYGEPKKICSDTCATMVKRKPFPDTYLEVHNFEVEERLVKFLAHWIHHRDPNEAIDATMNRQAERRFEVLDREWLDFLIKILNFFDSTKFTGDIADSLVDNFLHFLNCGEITARQMP